MNRERLTHLITVLEGIKPSLLEMSNWFGGEHLEAESPA